MSSSALNLVEVVLQRVTSRTGRRVRDLTVEFGGEWVVLRGRAGSYHVKQLATHAAREALPHVQLDNAIVVE